MAGPGPWQTQKDGQKYVPVGMWVEPIWQGFCEMVNFIFTCTKIYENMSYSVHTQYFLTFRPHLANEGNAHKAKPPTKGIDLKIGVKQ